MEKNPSLRVSKPISIWNKSIDINFKKTFLALSKATVKLASGHHNSAIKEAVSVIDSLKIKDNPSEITYSLIISALINASYNLISENISKFESLKYLEKIYDNNDFIKFINGIDELIESQNLTIDKEFLEFPHQLNLVEKFEDYFFTWVQFFGLNKIDAENLKNRFPSYYVYCLNNEWRSNNKKYELIQKYFKSPFSDSVEKELAWEQYSSLLEKQINEPVFGESFSLKQIYVPLRCRYTQTIVEEEKKVNGNLSEKKRILKKIKVFGFVESILNQWLRKFDDKKTSLKILSGGPGSGKSSLAKIWAAKLNKIKEINTLLIPLHLFDIQGDLIQSVGKFVHNYSAINLKFNPLDEISSKNRLLIIFDGLDELSQQGVIAAEVAYKFVSEVERTLNFKNSNELSLFVLITGRELVIQNFSNEFRQEGQVINLLPYKIPFNYYNPNQKVIGGDHIMSVDQREIWWTKFNELTGNENQNLPKILSSNKLEEITSQPLLNYLVALSFKRGKLDFTSKTNLNEIYKDLLEGVYERGWEGREYKAIKGLKFEDFVRILEEIAVTAWKGGDVRTTTVNRIENHIKKSGLTPILDVFKENAKTGITRLLTAFYFREHGIEGTEQTFEFTHKSFGEYLTACRLVKLILSINNNINRRKEDYDSGYDNIQGLLKWINVAGHTAIDSYLFNFLKNEVNQIHKDELLKAHKTILELIRRVLQKGYPLDTKRNEHLEESRRVRNAKEGLFIFHKLFSKITKETLDLTFLKNNSLGELIAILQPQRITTENTLAYDCFNFLKFSNQILEYKDMNGMSLEYCNIENANFIGTNLIATKLNYSVIKTTKLNDNNSNNISFNHSSLIKLNFQNSKISKGNFIKASINSCDFENAILDSSNFNESKLFNARFDNSFMKNSTFYKSRIEKTFMIEANLNNSSFKSSKLKEIILYRANLSDTDFSSSEILDSRFDGANLQYSRFNSSTIKNCDFTNSIISGANFTNTILEDCKGLTYKKLSTVRSLKKVKGISDSILSKLKKDIPRLFE